MYSLFPWPRTSLSFYTFPSLFHSRCSIFHSFIWGTRQLLLEPSPGLSLTFFFLFLFLCFFTFHCLQFLIFRQPPLSSSLTQFELWPNGGRETDIQGEAEAHLCIFYGLLCDLNEINIGFTSTANGFGFVQAWLVGAPVFFFSTITLLHPNYGFSLTHRVSL